MLARQIPVMHRLFGSKRSANEGAWLIAGVIGMALATGVGRHAAIGKAVLNEKHSITSAPAIVRAERASVPAVCHTRDLPPHVDLDVPFTAQAPYGDWSAPYEEACEEASVLMAVAWAQGRVITPEQANTEILKMVDFENYYFGYHSDTALRETEKLITQYFGYPAAAVFYDISPDDIRSALADGNAVIVPIAGALLPNPYFLDIPPYHMVVIRGYDDALREFLVNDPGTRHGEQYRYPYDMLWNAIRDWTGSDETILNGRKGMIVVAPSNGGSTAPEAHRY